MLQRFIAFIDSLGERLNPYFVLHQRRAFRASKTWITVPIIHSLFALAALIGLVYSDLIEHRLRELPSPATFTFMSPMLSFYFVFFAFGATLAPWINYRVVKKADPLMLVTPLSKREVYFGFHQINVWGNAAFFLMLSPWLAILYHARLIPLSWATLYPFLFWFLSFTLENTLFSVSLAPNKLYQTVILGILWSVVFTAAVLCNGKNNGITTGSVSVNFNRNRSFSHGKENGVGFRRTTVSYCCDI